MLERIYYYFNAILTSNSLLYRENQAKMAKKEKKGVL